jgi:tryptophan synthase beta subunit
VTFTPTSPNSQSTAQRPDPLGQFGQFRGKYVPETLMPALTQLEAAYQQYCNDSAFEQELQQLLRDYVKRAEYYSVKDRDGVAALQRLALLEGIIPALETVHAIAYLETLCPQLDCSGRGDKDVQTVVNSRTKQLNRQWKNYLLRSHGLYLSLAPS